MLMMLRYFACHILLPSRHAAMLLPRAARLFMSALITLRRRLFFHDTLYFALRLCRCRDSAPLIFADAGAAFFFTALRHAALRFAAAALMLLYATLHDEFFFRHATPLPLAALMPPLPIRRCYYFARMPLRLFAADAICAAIHYAAIRHL